MPTYTTRTQTAVLCPTSGVVCERGDECYENGVPDCSFAAESRVRPPLNLSIDENNAIGRQVEQALLDDALRDALRDADEQILANVIREPINRNGEPFPPLVMPEDVQTISTFETPPVTLESISEAMGEFSEVAGQAAESMRDFSGAVARTFSPFIPSGHVPLSAAELHAAAVARATRRRRPQGEPVQVVQGGGGLDLPPTRRLQARWSADADDVRAFQGLDSDAVVESIAAQIRQDDIESIRIVHCSASGGSCFGRPVSTSPDCRARGCALGSEHMIVETEDVFALLEELPPGPPGQNRGEYRLAQVVQRSNNYPSVLRTVDGACYVADGRTIRRATETATDLVERHYALAAERRASVRRHGDEALIHEPLVHSQRDREFAEARERLQGIMLSSLNMNARQQVDDENGLSNLTNAPGE